jgi:hypothetical protein
VTVSLAASILPDGWTIDSAFGAASKQQGPAAETMRTFHVGCAMRAPYKFDIAGLASGTIYIVSAWFQMTKPDGAKAYGKAQTAIAAAR